MNFALYSVRYGKRYQKTHNSDIGVDYMHNSTLHSKAFKEAIRLMKESGWTPETEQRLRELEKVIRLEERMEFYLAKDRYLRETY